MNGLPPAELKQPAEQPPGRRERNKARLRQSLIESAIELFDSRGVAETTVADVCERADVSEKTFFNYFPSRAQLLRAIADQSLEELFAQLDAAREQSGDTAGRVRVFFDNLAEAAEQRGPLRRELLSEMIHSGHDDGGRGEQARRLHDAFAAFLRGDDLRSDRELDSLVELVMGAFYVLMFNWANLDDYPLRRQAVAVAELLAESVTGTRLLKTKGE